MNKDFEIVVTIVTKGQSDKVVEATRKAGARGGTILFGRGTSPRDYESILGVHILPEKEIVLTIVDSAAKQKMMKLICEEAHLSENGNGLCFSLPINNIVGSKKLSEPAKMTLHSSKQMGVIDKNEKLATNESTAVQNKNVEIKQQKPTSKKTAKTEKTSSVSKQKKQVRASKK